MCASSRRIKKEIVLEIGIMCFIVVCSLNTTSISSDDVFQYNSKVETLIRNLNLYDPIFIHFEK